METFRIITDRPIIEGQYNPEEEYSPFNSDDYIKQLNDKAIGLKPKPSNFNPSGNGLAVSFAQNQQNSSKVKGHLLNTFDFLNSKLATDQNDPSLSKLKMKNSLWDKQFDKLKKDTPTPVPEITPNTIPTTNAPFNKDQGTKTPMKTMTKVLIGIGIVSILTTLGIIIYKNNK